MNIETIFEPIVNNNALQAFALIFTVVSGVYYITKYLRSFIKSIFQALFIGYRRARLNVCRSSIRKAKVEYKLPSLVYVTISEFQTWLSLRTTNIILLYMFSYYLLAKNNFPNIYDYSTIDKVFIILSVIIVSMFLAYLMWNPLIRYTAYTQGIRRFSWRKLQMESK